MAERTTQRLEDTLENREKILQLARAATAENPVWVYSRKWTQYPGMHTAARVLCSCCVSGHTPMKSPNPHQVVENILFHFEYDTPLTRGEYFEVTS